MAFIYLQKNATHCLGTFVEEDIWAFVLRLKPVVFFFASHESGHITALTKLYSTAVKVLLCACYLSRSTEHACTAFINA